MESYCFCCGDDLSSGEAKKRRRLLASPDLQGSLSVLIRFASEQQVGIDVSRLQTGHVCRSCAAMLERCHNLHLQITDKLRGAVQRLPSLGDVAERSPVARPARMARTPRRLEGRTVGTPRSLQVAGAGSSESPPIVVSNPLKLMLGSQ